MSGLILTGLTSYNHWQSQHNNGIPEPGSKQKICRALFNESRKFPLSFAFSWLYCNLTLCNPCFPQGIWVFCCSFQHNTNSITYLSCQSYGFRNCFVHSCILQKTKHIWLLHAPLKGNQGKDLHNLPAVVFSKTPSFANSLAIHGHHFVLLSGSIHHI